MREDIKKRTEVVRAGKVPANYKRTDSGIMPEAWVDSTVGDIIEFHNEKSTINNEYPVLTSARSGLVLQTEYFEGQVTREENSGYNVMPYGYITYRSRSDDGRFTFNQNKVIGKGIVSCFYPVFRVKEESAVSEFVLSYLNNCLGRQIVKEIVGTSQLVLSEKKLSDLRMPCPPLAEQQKIAEILATCDRVIELKQQLLDEKRKQKQWLMQMLLDPNSGKRLPGFEGSEWYTVTLGEYCDCLDTLRKPVNAQQREKMQGNYPYWGANSIQGYVSEYIFDEEIVLLAEDGGSFDDFKTKPIAVFVNEKCWVNNHAHILRAKNGNTKLLYFLLVHKDIRNYINGTTRSKLTRGDMMSISITLPKNPQEQKRLIEVLTVCEAEIDLFEQELDAWQQKKKALMQLLLTGLVRVNA